LKSLKKDRRSILESHAGDRRAGNVSKVRKNPLAIYDLIKQDIKIHEGL
jgi:hypothetical protein